MKKQLTIATALAAALMSPSLFALVTHASGTTVVTIAQGADRQNQLTGGDAQFVTDTYNFNLSAGVAFKFVQDATAIGAAAATLKGTGAIYGGSTSGGIQECGGEVSDASTAAPGDPTATDGCAGSAS